VTSGVTIWIKDETTGKYRWIDYDFNYRHGESRFAYDLFG